MHSHSFFQDLNRAARFSRRIDPKSANLWHWVPPLDVSYATIRQRWPALRALRHSTEGTQTRGRATRRRARSEELKSPHRSLWLSAAPASRNASVSDRSRRGFWSRRLFFRPGRGSGAHLTPI